MPDGMPVAGMRGAVARLSPRVWTALLSGLAAVLLLGLGMLVVHVAGDAGQAGLLLRWSPPVVAAPVLSMLWCTRAAAPARGAGRLAARVVVLTVLLLVPAMLSWGVLVTGAEHLFATRPTRLAEDLAWLPPAVAVLWGALVLYGIAPMSLAQYLICRRCLRRRPSFTEGEIR